MAWAGSYNRQSECHVDGPVKSDQLQGNVPLIVIHRRDTIKLALDCTTKQSIGRDGAGGDNSL